MGASKVLKTYHHGLKHNLQSLYHQFVVSFISCVKSRDLSSLMCNVKERFQNFSDCKVSSLCDVGKMQVFFLNKKWILIWACVLWDPSKRTRDILVGVVATAPWKRTEQGCHPWGQRHRPGGTALKVAGGHLCLSPGAAWCPHTPTLRAESVVLCEPLGAYLLRASRFLLFKKSSGFSYVKRGKNDTHSTELSLSKLKCHRNDVDVSGFASVPEMWVVSLPSPAAIFPPLGYTLPFSFFSFLLRE